MRNRHVVQLAGSALALWFAFGCTDNATPPTSPASDLQSLAAPTLSVQQSGTTNRLQAVSPVSERVIWASGTGGTYTITTDGGQTWHAAQVPAAHDLEFRDVQGFSDKVAYLLSAGPGNDSRIYYTSDGGQHWSLQFINQDPNAFYDCFDFWGPNRGLTTSDAVNGVFPVIKTDDGVHWTNIGANLPAAQPGEASFAASGTCIATQGSKNAWIGTGGGAKARVLATTDAGRTWNAYDTPIVQGTPSSGVVSLAFRDALHGILGGGELATPEAQLENTARSGDGGKTWTLATPTPFTGSIYGLAYIKGTVGVVATGPRGSAWSSDEGTTWKTLTGLKDYWAVAFASARSGWLVGVGGRIVKVSF